MNDPFQDVDKAGLEFASVHASFHNLFNSKRSLSKRSTFKLNRDAALLWLPPVMQEVFYLSSA